MTKLTSSLACVLVVLAMHSRAAADISVGLVPATLDFGKQAQGVASSTQSIIITNLGTSTASVTMVTVTPSDFQLASGTVPVNIAAGQTYAYGFTFTPSAAKQITGTITFAVTGQAAKSVTVTGTGTNPNAIATVTPSSLDFGNVALGSIGGPKNVQITNTGTQGFTIINVAIDSPPFLQSAFTKNVQLNKGQSFTLPIRFSSQNVATAKGNVVFSYDVVADSAVSLSGAGVATTRFGITNFPTLPAATQAANYLVQLATTQGVGSVSWTLATNSKLPSGLAVNSSGLINGTVSSSVTPGNYFFTSKATDSAVPPNTVSQNFTLPVDKSSGASCNTISYNIAGSINPLVPLTDLGTAYYLGSETGGLFANGSNVRPADNDAYGVSLAQQIQPLDGNGNPSTTGKYGLVAVGVSTTEQPFIEFLSLANSDFNKNAALVLVNGGQGGATAYQMSQVNSSFWTNILNAYIPNVGLTPQQIVAAWVNDSDGSPTGVFPSDMSTLQSEYASIAQNLLTKFPNIKIAYFSSFNYAGYSNQVTNLNPEPYAYESGFAVKNLIQDQINGDPNLNYDLTKGTVKAPWLTWGPYLWANGLLARSDGLSWSCQDYMADGTHPSNPGGRAKTAYLLLNFLETDDTASPWFLAPAEKKPSAGR